MNLKLRSSTAMHEEGASVIANARAGGHVVLAGGDVQIHEAAGLASPLALRQLPAPPGDFTGREAELNELLAKIKDGGVSISGLRGMGGVGKTALALMLADRLKPGYPDGQIYMDLKGTSQTPLRVAEIQEKVIRSFHPDSKIPEDEGQLEGLYRSVLDGKKVLLLMDNAADAGQVRPLIPPRGCAMLVTSRNHFSVPGLFSKEIDSLPEADARELLLVIAPRIGDQAGPIAELCGCLPLALRAAANLIAVTPSLDPAEYANLLRNERTRLEKLGATDIPASVEASIRVSYDLLNSECQLVFRQLAVFPGSFNGAAEARVCEDEGSALLAELERWSLVQYDENTKRHKLHDLVRLLADGRLSETERAGAERRHAFHYKDVLAEADDACVKKGESLLKALRVFDGEWVHIRAGQAWAARHSEGDREAASLCSDYPDAGTYILNLRQHPREQVSWREAALGAARRLGDRRVEGVHLGNLGFAYESLGDYPSAIEYLEQSLAIAREMGGRREESAALGSLGLVCYALSEYRQAIEYQKQSLAIAREIGNRLGEAAALGNLGLVYQSLGDYRRAIDCHKQSLAIARRMAYRVGEGNALGDLGIAYHSLGDYQRAMEYLKQSLAIARELGNRYVEGQCLGNVGSAYYSLGEYPRAIECYEQRLAIAREMGDRRGEGSGLGNLGNAYHSLGYCRRAIDYQEQHLAIAREIGDRSAEGNSLHSLALAKEKLEHYAEALENAEAALKIRDEIEDPRAPGTRELAERLRARLIQD